MGGEDIDEPTGPFSGIQEKSLLNKFAKTVLRNCHSHLDETLHYLVSFALKKCYYCAYISYGNLHVPIHLVLTDSRKCPLVSSMLNHITTENCYWVISTSSLDWLISVQLAFPYRSCLIKHHNFQSIPYKFAILFFNSEDNQTRGWSAHDCTVMRRSFQRSFYAFFFICIGIMPAFKNIMWLTVYPPSPSASFLRHRDITAGLAIGQDIERGFEKRIECLSLPWVSGGCFTEGPCSFIF